ncbi:CBS domain-containing protein [Rhodopila sp.]|uniref:CBS domain-containing protein n=1 Tax=Rhodopila sp. TaxID=2480087 RepID=UPI002C6B7346|nr:CBS domain-containing protein [Rhodopila sp.]HVZ08149.1 CBS domain-containing protein [Rhodopila sp.]
MTIIAADIMSSPVITVRPNTTVGEVARLMSKHRISAVVVVDSADRILGIISEADVLKPYRESILARRAWWLDLIAEGEEMPKDFLEYLRQDRHVAADVMVSDVVTADHRMTIPQLAELAVQKGVRRLPVVKDGKLVGIVSRHDLIRAIAGSRDALS